MVKHDRKFLIDKHCKTTYGQFRSECSSYRVYFGLMFFQKRKKIPRAIDSKVGMNEVEASRLYTTNECGWVEYDDNDNDENTRTLVHRGPQT